MYYTEVDGTEPTVSTQVGGIKYTFTNESLTKLIEEKEQLKVELAQLERKFRSARFDVREFFQSKYETDSDEIVCEVDDVNELLISLETEALTRSWSATITITATVTGLEAPNQDAAKDMLDDAFELNMTVDGDVWIDELTVESVYPEA
jgi:hypothetical protein